MWPFKKSAVASPAMPPSHEAVRIAIDAVEEELQRTKIWDVAAPTPEALAQAGAFGQPSLAFEQWLVHIFVPRVRSILASGGAFPHSSQVGDQAFREWRMWGQVPDVDELIARLRIFDALFH